MRKTIKKALSAVLSASLVLTGFVAVGSTTADAKGDTLTWTGSASMSPGDYKAEAVEVKTDDSSTIKLVGNDYNNLMVEFDVDLSAFDDPTITVTAAANAGMNDPRAFAVCDSNWKAIVGINNDFSKGEEGLPATQETLTGKLDKSIGHYLITAQGRTITKVVISDGEATTPSDPTAAPTDPTTPPTTDKLFTAHMASFGTIWGWVADPDGKNATPGAWSVDVTGAGEYTVTAEATNDCDSSGAALVVNTDLKALPSGYTLVGKTFKINDKEYDWSKAEVYLDGTYYRLSIWNEWGDEKANPIGQDLEINAGDKIEATFAVVETKPLFTAHLASFGTIWGWVEDPTGKPATPGAWQIDVTGAGDYTVSGEATNDCDSSGGVLAVLTTLKEVPTDYAIVGKTLKVNDKVYDWSKAQAYLDGDYVRISVWNEWGDEKANTISEDIEINAGDKVEATISVVEPQKPVDPIDPQPPVVTKKVLGTAKGKTFTAGNFKYKVTTAATIEGTKKTAGKVTVVGLSSAGKKKTSINVKNTVSVKSTGASYKVTAIGSKAFKNASKLKSATLGTNIKSIPASAFAGCKKLSKLSVKKTLSSVKKNAFKGCKKTIKVTGGSKKVNKANVKKLKKSGYKKFK